MGVVQKPSHKFPLSYHRATGQWCKKHRGRTYYFGTNQDKALARYVQEWDGIIKHGRQIKSNPDAEGATLDEVCNRFLVRQSEKVEQGTLSPRAYDEYRTSCLQLLQQFGRQRLANQLDAADFLALRNAIARRYKSPFTVANRIQRVRTIFKYASESGLLLAPIRYGPDFAKPSQKDIRRYRASQGSRAIAANDVRRLIEAADNPLKAMILLAINCGFGQTDLAELPSTALSREGWVVFPRPKTGAERRCRLWPETAEALKAAIAVRPKPQSEKDWDCVFITKYGRRWVRYTRGTDGKSGQSCDAAGQEFNRLASRLGIEARFYDLRRTYRTVADACLDQPAVMLTMGHIDASISDVYRQYIADDRLERVAETVRGWLMT